MTLAQLLAQQRAARRELQQLARVAPAAFDSRGRPIVATLRIKEKDQ